MEVAANDPLPTAIICPDNATNCVSANPITGSQLTFDAIDYRVSLPALRLDLGPAGFSGTGIAVETYDCDDGTTPTAEVLLTVAPSDEQPTLQPSYSFPGPDVPAGGIFTFYSAWSLSYGEDGGCFFHGSLCDGPSLLEAVDGDTGTPLPLQWTPSNPDTGRYFTDLDAAVGHSVQFRLLQPLTSFTGDLATIEERSYTIVDSGPPVERIDFDDGPHDGAHGAAVYHAGDSPDTPCESGACLELTGPLRTPTEWDELGPSSFLAFRIPAGTSSELRIRARLLSSADHAPPLWLWACDAARPDAPDTSLEPLLAPSGEYTHGSDWMDRSFPLCPNNTAEELGEQTYAVALGSHDEALAVSALIERIELYSE